jgi:hypothetical protein
MLVWSFVLIFRLFVYFYLVGNFLVFSNYKLRIYISSSDHLDGYNKLKSHQRFRHITTKENIDILDVNNEFLRESEKETTREKKRKET